MVFGDTIEISTRGFSDIHNVTPQVEEIIDRSGIGDGIVCVSIIGSTASVSTIEYEPALVEDMRDKLEEFASRRMQSRHSQTWGDDNGFAHIRATFMGPGIALPLAQGRLVAGTWQQIVVIDHDNRGRNRKIFVQIVGE